MSCQNCPEPRTTHYCIKCGQSPQSGDHTFGACTYSPPPIAQCLECRTTNERNSIVTVGQMRDLAQTVRSHSLATKDGVVRALTLSNLLEAVFGKD